jgi:phosphoribosylamine---glycine ligase
MLESGRFGDAGSTVVIERRLRGRELSVMALTDGARYEILAQAEDHKAVHDGDRGPNTGGMGTVSPAAWATDALLDRVRREIFDPTMKAFADEGIDYRGVLYAGLMIDDAGAPWILEYNCRFGDPETQAVVVRLDGDLAPWLLGAAQGALPEGSLAWDARASVCVVLAAANYPASPELGDSITGIEAAEALGDVTVFHAGTQEQDDQLVTSGGRVLGVTALGADVEAARELGYRAAGAISFRGMHYRGDIGARPTGERGG